MHKESIRRQNWLLDAVECVIVDIDNDVPVNLTIENISPDETCSYRLFSITSWLRKLFKRIVTNLLN